MKFFPALPWLRRKAVEATLLRDPSPGVPAGGFPDADSPLPEPRILARGILDALQILSSAAQLLIAVDDAQWLDRPTAGRTSGRG